MSGNLDAKGDKGVSTESSRSLSELLKRNDSRELILRLLFQVILLIIIGVSIWLILFSLRMEPLAAFFFGFIFAGLFSFILSRALFNWKKSTQLYKKIVNLPGSSLNMNHFNPYIVGAPVPPDKFYGRQQMVNAILAALRAKNHVAIYGERRIGKTSLLHRLDKLLREESEMAFIPLFIQMQMLSEEKFFSVLIDTVLKSIPIAVNTVLPSLQRQTVQSYEALDLLNDLETVIKAWNQVQKNSLQLIFLLDEGDRLNEFGEMTQMQLRGLFMNTVVNQHVRLVWSGGGIDRTWHSDTSPWFNLFKSEFHLNSLKPEEARSLILKPVAGLYEYEEAAVAKIQELSLNKPYLIQCLCSKCIDYVQEHGRTSGCITLKDIKAILAENPEFLHSQLFHHSSR